MSPPATKAAQRTREAILDAAEELFAEGGIHATSLRAITSAAEVNLASVSYHFGSKEGLVRAVFSRHIQPVNEERLRLLAEAEEAAGAEGPGLEEVLRAFLVPVLGKKGHEAVVPFKRLLGRIFFEPGDEVRRLFKQQFEETAARFVRAISRAAPHLPPTVLLWRFHFMIGSMVHVAQSGPLILEHSQGRCDPARSEEVLERLVEHHAAGFRAPVSAAEASAVEASAVEASGVAKAAPGFSEEPRAAKEPQTEEDTSPAGRRPSSEGIFAWEEGF